ncbi:developmental pluripotency-associated protein 2 isoform X2 [Pelobates fuscus]|uniref:developmental pluripotency-associated protein 2 isoform X2 n=1 Tax=Pelobates fuscus TaxID=191477 RepID=UPI002FE4F1D1
MLCRSRSMATRCSTMPIHKPKAAPLPQLDLTPSSLHLLKRAQLQQYCKRLGLGGGGKNSDLLQRLQDHHKQTGLTVQVSPRAASQEKSGRNSAKEKTERQWWCVVHGQQFTSSTGVKLSPCCGRLGVTIGGSFVPLHLTPSSLPVPHGFEDNIICGECLERNKEKESRLLQESTNQERQCWCVVHGHLLTTSKWIQLSLRRGHVGMATGDTFVPLHLTPSSLPVPPNFEDNRICGECLERNNEKESRLRKESVNQDENCPPTMHGKTSSVSICRNRNKSGKFQPREDPAYARKVDEILGQLAKGQVDSEQVLQPKCPAVIHSPVAKQESSPLSINQRHSANSH